MRKITLNITLLMKNGRTEADRSHKGHYRCMILLTSESTPVFTPKKYLAVMISEYKSGNLLISVTLKPRTGTGLLKTCVYLELRSASHSNCIQCFSSLYTAPVIRSSQRKSSSGSSMCLKISSPFLTSQLMYSSKLRHG